MAINQKHYDEIKADFEKDKGWLLSLHLSNKQYLVKELLPDYPIESRVSFQATSFSWNDFSNTSHEEEDVYSIKTSFRTDGILIFYELLREVSRQEITLDLTIEIPCRHIPTSDTILYARESIVVMNQELKTIVSFDEIVLKEFNSLTMLKPLDFGIIDKIWPYNEVGNEIHVFISGYSYFSEIDNMYRQVRHSIALANTYAHYANNYFETEAREPFVHYPINFTSHDRRYLDYCTNAIQSMYVFWERLALLIYQYHQPPKVSERNLSFVKLIGAIIREQNDSSTKIDIVWFENFLRDDHSKLQLLRHPLIHFKLDPTQNKGSYIPMIHTHWLKNIKNKKELLEMENNSKQLIGEIIELGKKCYDGYGKTIQLIVDLKSALPLIQPNDVDNQKN